MNVKLYHSMLTLFFVSISAKVTMHVLMMKLSDIWQSCIAALTTTCLAARNLKQESQMELIGMLANK